MKKQVGSARWRRGWWLAVAIFIGAFVWRLSYLQIVQAAQYNRQAEQNRVWRQLIRAPRGEIRDRYGKVMAGNTLQYSWLYEENDQVKEKILSEEEAVYALATAAGQVRKTYRRTYPLGPVVSHLIGYVQQPFTSADVVVGQLGLERLFHDQLSGQDGLEVYERNAMGVPTRLLAQQSASKGQDLQLSIDAELSTVAFSALGNQRGSVIVSEPNTGKILVAVSKPSFWPLAGEESSLAMEGQALIASSSTAPSEVISANIAEALRAPNHPFLFRPLAAVYPPGSVFKIVTALAGLEYQAFDAGTTVNDQGELKVGEFTYQNWYWRQYGRVEGEIGVVRALARSNDIFFYKAAEWIGPQRLADFSRILGLGKTTQLGFPGEQAGLVPDPVWKQQRFGEPWYLGNTYHMGIGQGDVLVTPMQIQMVTSAVAGKGRLCQPQVELQPNPQCQELSLQEESVRLVREGLREACASSGTAFPFFSAPYEVICKTGTAEFGAEDAAGHRKTHGWFTAAVSRQLRSEETPIDEFEPELIITVMVESDDTQPFKEGSREAAPVAKEVVDWWMRNR